MTCADRGFEPSWSRRENLHLTLEFLGELDSAKEAIAAMEQVQAAPFRLEFAPSGRFRRQEGDIFWLGIQPNEGLMELQKQLHHALQAQGLQLETLIPIILTSPWLVTCEIRVKSCFRSHFRRRCWCQNLF